MLVVGSIIKNANEGNESLKKMTLSVNFVQPVKFKHCLLVLKGLYAKCFQVLNNVLKENKTYFGTSVCGCVRGCCAVLLEANRRRANTAEHE